MRADPYFAQRGPKSTGRDQFNSHWLDNMLARHAAERAQTPDGAGSPLSDAEVQASLVALTAQTIAAEIPAGTSALYLCGGGAKNPVLRQALHEACRAAGCAADLQTTDALGWPVQEVEAAAFAWLAYCCVSGQAGNLPRVTGARGPRILGSITRGVGALGA
jgi:anhydro-N-acetylmuramic acid kinase